ncbi:MAG: amidase [Planctomycetia bacterium]|nr:amidase [Planctomycetia bacterium]
MPLSLNPSVEETLLGRSHAIRERRITCSETLDRCRSMMREYEPSVQAWVRFGGEELDQAADALDAELRHGNWRGPLHGIPVGIKDIYDIADQPTTAGIPNRQFEPAHRDAVLVKRLRNAGAIIVGKTVTTPYAFFDTPPTRNPWNLDRTPGGSSSGSAAAVATGMCLGALGSQTGGSITRPASFCGIAGYKPTFGLLSRVGMFPFAPHLDHPGPMARTVDDLLVLMTAIAPKRLRAEFRALLNTPLDEGIIKRERTSHYISESCELSLLWLEEGFMEKIEPAMTEAMKNAVHHLAGCGACPGSNFADELDLPKLWRCHRAIMAVEIASTQGEQLRQHPEQFTAGIRALIEEGQAVKTGDYAEAIQFQRELRRKAQAAIGNEIWICPAARGAAPTLETTGDPCMNSPWSFLGFPTITFPMSLSPEGLPLGLQLIAAPHRDIELFQAARWCEAQFRHRVSS